MKKVLMMVANDFEDAEVRQPLDALKQAGFQVEIASPEAGKVYRGKKGKETVTSTIAIRDVKVEDYDALLLPGGYSPDHLRITPHAVEVVRHFANLNRPIAAVCHGPQLLISAELTQDRRMTCWASVVVDLENAGAQFVDQEVVVDGNFITSRKPDDLPAFSRTLISMLKGERVESR